MVSRIAMFFLMVLMDFDICVKNLLNFRWAVISEELLIKYIRYLRLLYNELFLFLNYLGSSVLSNFCIFYL